MHKILLAPALALSLAACAAPQARTDGGPPTPPWESKLRTDHPLVGTVWDPAAGQQITVDEAVSRLTKADFVLLGETHDNPDHHALQAWAVRTLIAKGRKPALSFEMIEPAQKPKLVAYRAENPGDTDGLGDAIAWSKGWPDWKLYAPIMEPVIEAGLPVLPANVDREVIRELVRSKDSLEDKELKAGLLPASPDVAAKLAEDIREGHCNMLPEEQVPAMALTQRARDRAMAKSMIEGLAESGVNQSVLISGAGHARTDIAVPLHLRDLAKGRAVVSLAFIEAGEHVKAPLADFPYDLVWITPKANDADHCADLQKQMEQMKKHKKAE